MEYQLKHDAATGLCYQVPIPGTEDDEETTMQATPVIDIDLPAIDLPKRTHKKKKDSACPSKS